MSRRPRRVSLAFRFRMHMAARPQYFVQDATEDVFEDWMAAAGGRSRRGAEDIMARKLVGARQ